jgi:hypothetical protein
MKISNCALLVLALVPALANAGEEQIKTNAALEAYKKQYSNMLDHRAFAQSPDTGAWYFSAYEQSRESAAARALSGCNARVPAHGSPCVVINVNGEWKR